MHERMYQRGITQRDIEHALENYTASWQTPQDSVQYIGPSIDGRVLKVWVVAPGLVADRPILKSAAWRDVDDEPDQA